MVPSLVFPICDSPLLLIHILYEYYIIFIMFNREKTPASAQRQKLEVSPIPTAVKSCERLMGAVWQRWGTAGWFSALVWLLQCMGNRDLCMPGKQPSCCGETPNSSSNFSPLPIGTAYQTLKFFSQGVLVCCDSWQHIPVGKWWTGSRESKINYEVGEISALQITVQWFHWNGSVWQHIQTHTAGQSTQALLYGIAACMGREGVLLG